MGEYMSSKEAASIWNTTPARVTKWCRDDKLKCGTKPCEQDKPGAPWRIRRDAIPPIIIKNKQ